MGKAKKADEDWSASVKRRVSTVYGLLEQACEGICQLKERFEEQLTVEEGPTDSIIVLLNDHMG